MSIFVNQTLIEIILDTKIDLSSASVIQINYKKPNGVRGVLPGTLEGTTKIKYQSTDPSSFDIAGIWNFQSFVTIGGFSAPGEIVTYEIKRII